MCFPCWGKDLEFMFWLIFTTFKWSSGCAVALSSALSTFWDLPHKHRCSQVFCQLWTFQMEQSLSGGVGGPHGGSSA